MLIRGSLTLMVSTIMICKICTKCGKEKDIEAFPLAQHTKKDGSRSLARVCRECKTMLDREWRRKNPEKVQ